MTTRPRLRHPAGFRAYYTAVLLAAAAVALWPPAALAPASIPSWPMLVGAFVLMVLSESRPVTLPGGGWATATTALSLPLTILAGPWWASVVDAAVTVSVHGIALRRPAVRVLHNVAIFTLGHFASAAAYAAAGGVVGRVEWPAAAGPLVAAGVTHFVANSLLVSTVLSLTTGPDVVRVWQRNFHQGLLHHLAFVALGVLLAVLWTQAGPWALVLGVLPFLVSQHSFRLYVELRSDLKDFVRTLTEVLEEVDPYTRHHSVRVAEYSVRLARGMRRSEAEVEELEYAALVHDLGKIGPAHQHILQKPGSLSHEEQRTLRAHPAAGAEIVAKVRALHRVAEIVRAHHERPDGQGYPFGLRSEDVPLGARVLNVADAFDAMTSDRPYRRALSMEVALRELERGAGTQFDAAVVECLLRLHREGDFALVPSPSSEDLQLLRLRTRVGGAG